MMGPNVDTINNAATPLATDFIRYLQGQLDAGAFSTGSTGQGPQQRGAIGPSQPTTGPRRIPGNLVQNQASLPGGGGGLPASGNFGSGIGQAGQAATSGIQSLVNASQQAVASGGMDPGTAALIEALTASSELATNRQAANLREAFGAAGSRFGSTLATGEARLRADAGVGLDQQIAQTLVGQQQSNVENLVRGLSLLQQQGQINILPFLQAMGLGIAPAENIVSPSVGSQLLAGGIDIASAFAGRGTTG
jgi:hypothetical protein